MRPIGSEKIENTDDKLSRILEIAGIKKGIIAEDTQKNGVQSTILHEATASNGVKYGIVKEASNVYIKIMNESGTGYEYIGGVQNIHEQSYRSYAEALKHLNITFKQINENVGHTENIDVLKKKV